MKRIFIICVLALMTMQVAAYDFESDGVCYDIVAASEVSVVSGVEPYAGSMTIPSEVHYQGQTYQVTAIGDKAFRNCGALVSIDLPATLKSIGESAFSSCAMLCKVGMPAGLVTIGDAAFYGCVSLFHVALPASVAQIGEEAFVRCAALRTFEVAADNATYCSVNGVLMNKQRTRLIAYPNMGGDDYVVPNGVTEIANWAFLGCHNLHSVSLPQGVLSVGNAAFQDCAALRVVSLPASLTTIGVWAFSECAELEQVTLGANVATIGEGAFSFCSQLQAIRIAGSNSQYTSVDGVLMTKDQRQLVAFPGGKGGNYRIPATVETIGGQAFYGCDQLRSVTLTERLSALGDNPFVFCDNLTEILVSNGNPEYASLSGVLLDKEKKTIVFYPNARSGAYTVPQGVTSLQHGPFMRSRLLTDVTIPAGVQTIGDWTFMECDELQTVSLPPTLNALGDRAFDCSGLRTVICGNEPAQTTAFASSDYSKTALYVPRGTLDTFYQTEGWNVFGSYHDFGLYMDYQTVTAGQYSLLPLMSSGPMRIASLEADIVMPDELRPQQAAGGYYVVLADKVSGTVSCEMTAPQTYHLTAQCDDQRQLGGVADVLLRLGVFCPLQVDEGLRDIELRNISFRYASNTHQNTAVQPNQLVTVNVIGGTGVAVIEADQQTGDVYNLQGQRVRLAGESLDGLSEGIYIVGGKKVRLSR